MLATRGSDELPEGQDNIYAAPTAAEIGLPSRDVDAVRELLADVPYLPAMRTLSVLAAAVFYARMSADSHRRLAALFYPESIRREVLRFIDGGSKRVAFDPRQIATLQRLVILHGAAADHPARPEAIQGSLAVALLTLAGVLPDGEPPDTDDALVDTDAWARYLVRNGLYHARPWIMEALARTWALYETVAPDLRHLRESCPIDEWLTRAYQFSLVEQLGLGLAFGGASGAFDPTLSVEERFAHRPGLGVLGTTALAAREADAVALISAHREELRARLATSDAMRLSWEHSVFESKPFLRGEDGLLLLHSPWALMSWMSRGLHYRVLDAAHAYVTAKGKPRSGDWLTHSGALGEEFVRRMLAGSLTTSSLRADRFHGEVVFTGPHGEQRSADAAIERGPDLVLFEVYSGRFSLDVRASEAPEPALDALQHATVDKLAEVLDRADDVLAGRFAYPGTVGRPKTIWPVVVLTGDSMVLTPLLWGWIRTRLEGRLDADPRIRRALIVDLDDLEPLLVLVERGHDIVDLFARFLRSESVEFDLRNWLAREFDLLAQHRPRYVREQWKQAMCAAGEVLYPGSKKIVRTIDTVDAAAQTSGAQA